MTEQLWHKDVFPHLLHIYGQECEHGEAQIQGTNDALKRLGEACIKASKNLGGQSFSVGMMAADGEWYSVIITPRGEHQMALLPEQYCQEREFN